MHDWEVECSFQRAARVMAEAAKFLPEAEVREKIEVLMAVDSFGVRDRLRAVVSTAGVDR